MMHHRIAILITIVLLSACASAAPNPQPGAGLSAVEAVGSGGTAGFARAIAPRDFNFPRDHGPHPEYATEWWYYTGNLDAQDGRHFGFQLTFFRSALAPAAPVRSSDWATTHIYMAHFALADVAGQRFYAFERFSRAAAGLAGAQAEPFRVWLEDWSAAAGGPSGEQMQLRAAQDGITVDLALAASRPVVLQGERGLSQKGAEPGNASYYYSLTRMETQGAISVGGQRYSVRGLSWMDHEFGTGALDRSAVGWDWFAIQLDDGRDLMYAQLRIGGDRRTALGLLIAADGSTRSLDMGKVVFDVLDRWQSQRSGASYPSAWRLQIPSAGLDLHITPYLADQELPLTVTYWEGAIKIGGTADGRPASGSGYVELTGYAETRR
jgi:predicted secreted hydrolase